MVIGECGLTPNQAQNQRGFHRAPRFVHAQSTAATTTQRRQMAASSRAISTRAFSQHQHQHAFPHRPRAFSHHQHHHHHQEFPLESSAPASAPSRARGRGQYLLLDLRELRANLACNKTRSTVTTQENQREAGSTGAKQTQHKKRHEDQRRSPQRAAAAGESR